MITFVYFLEAGFLLLVVPWSVFWERNLFVSQAGPLQSLLLNHYARGAISGIGVVCLAAAVGEVLDLWRRRASTSGRPDSPTFDANLPAR